MTLAYLDSIINDAIDWVFRIAVILILIALAAGAVTGATYGALKLVKLFIG